jgi:hypothetical protein
MAQLVRQVALVSQASTVAQADLMQCSAALQKQVTRDFGPIWEVDATVDAFADLDHVPLGYWPVLIVDMDPRLPDSALGVHLDDNNQPFALVKATATWQLTTSHEVLEMLADPFGNRLMAGDSPKADQGRVEFLVEVSDPSEAAQFGYTANGITVSDFYTPHYFDPVQAGGVQYSQTGAITEPRQVLEGGYLSWHDPVTDHWWQEQYFGDRPEFVDIGPLTGQGSLRAQIERKTNVQSMRSMVKNKGTILAAAHAFASVIARPSQARAAALRTCIERLKTGSRQEPPTAPPPRQGRRPTPRPGR